jgi:hypothetical protein
MKRISPIGFLAVGTVVLCFTLCGFVPSCEKELATLYPAALKADLSTCSMARPTVKATAPADISKFMRRLNGTWELKMRTIQGITSDTGQLSAKLYFDLVPASGSEVTGAALLLERPKDGPMTRVSTPRNEAVGFWDVTVAQKGKMALSLGMTGDKGSKLPGGIAPSVKGAEFAELNTVFVSLDNQTPRAQGWDRIIVSDAAMIYVSCQHGVIERYAKSSGQKPLVDGVSVKAYWQKQSTGRLTASSVALPGFSK